MVEMTEAEYHAVRFAAEHFRAEAGDMFHLAARTSSHKRRAQLVDRAREVRERADHMFALVNRYINATGRASS